MSRETPNVNDAEPAPADEQQPLREDGELYRLMIEAVQDYAIFLLDPDGQVSTWNIGAERILGYRSDEILGRHFTCFYTPEDQARGEPGRVLESAAEEGNGEAEGWRERRDGSRFWAHSVLTALRDQAGRLRGFSKIIRDLTERRRAEEALRSVVDHVVDGIITIDERGTIQSFNPAAETIFRYRAAEVLGRNVNVLMPEPYHGEHDGYLANYAATGQRKVIGIGREVVGRRSDGSTFPMDLAVSEFHLNDRRYFTGIVRDITERKVAENALREAEQRMRSVVNHVIDGIITIDERGTIEALNPAAETIFGYPAAEILGRNVRVLMPEPYRSEHDGYLANYRRTGQARIIGIGREVVGRRSDGSTFPMDLAVGEFHLGDRRLFTGIVRDITERKRLEQELRRRLQELAEADRRKDEFLAMLAHELRNPLAAINSAVQLSTVAGIEDQLDWCMDVINRQIKHLARLIDDLLDVSRITRGKIQLRKERVEVATVLQSAIESARPLIEARQHTLTLNVPDGSLTVEADPLRLEQVVTNLLTNAAKFTANGGQIDLSASREGDNVVIKVRDTGIGIAPDQISRMFELFAQGDRSLDRSEGGLGIGLTLARSLAELHGGSLTGSSAGPGSGSEFTVRLPAGPAAAASNGRGKAALTGPKKGARVLVIDDNVDLANGLSRLLRLLGHEVWIAHDGPSGLEAAETHRPDVILLDIGLPGMDGYQVAQHLRETEHGAHVLLIAVTGYGHEDDRQRARAVGFDHYVTKPVDYPTLLSLMSDPGALAH